MSNPIPGVSFWLYLKLLKHFSLELETKWLYVSTHVIGEKFIGVCSSFEIFRSLKVSSNRQKFVTFHLGSILTNFKISNVSEKENACIFFRTHTLFSSTAMSMSISQKSIIFSLPSWISFVPWLPIPSGSLNIVPDRSSSWSPSFCFYSRSFS